MASPYRYHHPSSSSTSAAAAETSGPRAKCDQVVFEAVAKACEIIVSSRRCSEYGTGLGSGKSNNTIIGHGAAGFSSSSGTTRPGTAAAAASTGASSRFNLHVPEVPRVRAILQRSRGALHVPLRLDVFFEQPNGAERLLLERWCLEYRISGIENFLNKEGVVGDAIVQLRHVCKRVVIWLRTLCCWIRLLPAQCFKSNVGFSLYHHDEAVTDLLQQGFQIDQPQARVTTPYGELLWMVAYTPHVRPAATTAAAAATRPIPIPKSLNSRNPGDQSTASSSEGQKRIFLAPKSAPHKAPINWHVGGNGPAPTRHEMHGTNTYDPSRFYQRRVETTDSNMQLQQHHHLQPALLRRRHTDMETIEDHSESLFASAADDDDDKPPTRVLSGLSLALLEDSKRRAFHEMPPHLLEHHQLQQRRDNKEAGPEAHPAGSGTRNDALSEYGYGYNNQIPWQTIHPSNSKPIDTVIAPSRPEDQRRNSASPHMFTSPPLASTPPSAAFLRSPSPMSSPFQQPPLHQHYQPHQQLLPPSTTGATTPLAPNLLSSTPPFRPRPTGLTGSSTAIFPPDLSLPGATAHRPDVSRQMESLPAPLDSLDASPFEASQQLSLGGGGGPGALATTRSRLFSEHANSMLLGPSIDFRRSLFAGGTSASAFAMDAMGDDRNTDDDDDEDEELPFAVDPGELLSSSTSASKPPATTTPSSSSHDVSASAILFAQKLGKLHARPMFASSTHPTGMGPSPGSADVDQLSDQLAEFRSFGASLNLVGNGSLGNEGEAGVTEFGGGSSSTSTPISLRT